MSGPTGRGRERGWGPAVPGAVPLSRPPGSADRREPIPPPRARGSSPAREGEIPPGHRRLTPLPKPSFCLPGRNRSDLKVRKRSADGIAILPGLR